MAKRSEVLELAVLGFLHDAPMHGYELRKRLNATLGSFRAFSYGSLYPCLRDMQHAGWIRQGEDEPGTVTAPALTGRRGRIVYSLTAEGKERLQELLGDAGPDSWEDETFGVHFALFGKTDADVRLRILEGRRSRLEERRAGLRVSLARTRDRLDSYTAELQRHGLESVEREVRWLNELIASERSDQGEGAPGRISPPSGPAGRGPEGAHDSPGAAPATGRPTVRAPRVAASASPRPPGQAAAPPRARPRGGPP